MIGWEELSEMTHFFEVDENVNSIYQSFYHNCATCIVIVNCVELFFCIFVGRSSVIVRFV